ncbi:MAG: FkbM family methyltransferase, partial [Promethearchaeia archaeon]
MYVQQFIDIHEGAVIFNVGANIGLFSLYLSQKLSGVQIYAFEPVPPIFEVLKENLDYLENIKLFNVGLGEESGDLDIYYYPKVSADSTPVPFDMELKVQQYKENYKERVCRDMPIARLVPSFLRKSVIRLFLKRYYRSEVIPCKIQTLSEIISHENIQQIDLLKIDAENYEKHVLAGI